MSRLSLHQPSLGAAVALAFSSCGGGLADAGSGAGGTPECLSDNECPVGSVCTDFGSCQPVGGGEMPPPGETEYTYAPPVYSDRYVFVAMTDSDAVAVIDGQSLEVTSIPVGDQPRVLSTIPGASGAVVLDQTNHTADIVWVQEDGHRVVTVPTMPNMNQLVVDPTGRYAIAWFDLFRAAEEAGGIDNVGEVGSFQDVSVIALEPGAERLIAATVGFFPRRVTFDDAGEHAFVITDDGISAIAFADLTGSIATVPPIAVSPDPLADPTGMEILVTRSGDHAIVREEGVSELRVVALAGADAGLISIVDLPAEPSDVDLSPDGSRAYPVLPATGQLAVVDVPGDALGGDGIELIDVVEHPIGSVELSRQGDRAVLYTNATVTEQVTVVDLVADGYPQVTFPLEKAVQSVSFVPSGRHAFIVHAKEAGDPGETGISVEDYIDRSHGYGFIDVETGFSRLQLSPVRATKYTFSAVTDRTYVLFDDPEQGSGVAETHQLTPAAGTVRIVEHVYPPDSIGFQELPNAAFVSQRHPFGRISFIRDDTGAVQTITGFDRNNQITD